MDKIIMAILALLVGIVLGVIIILVVNYFRGKSNENKATKIIDQAKKDGNWGMHFGFVDGKNDIIDQSSNTKDILRISWLLP